MNKYIRFSIGLLPFLISMILFGQTKENDVVINGEIIGFYNSKIPMVDIECDTIFSFLSPSEYSSGIAWDGQFLWQSNYFHRIYKLDTLGNILDSIDLQYQYNGGLYSDGTYLWCVSEQDAKLSKINLLSSAIQYFDLPTKHPGDPNCWGVTIGDGFLWISEYGYTSYLYKIDTATIAVIDTILIENNIMAIEWLEDFIIGINYPNRKLFKIDPISGSLLDSISWCILKPCGITITDIFIWNISYATHYGGTQRTYKIMSDFIVPTVIREDQATKNSFHIFPNPTNNEITIECEQFQDGINYSCEITNITGKTIKQVYIKNRSQIIDVDKMITGMYFIKINYGSKVFSAKIIKL